MLRILMITGLLIGITAGILYAEKVHMVERHIFLPEVPAEQKEELPVAPAANSSAIEKEIQFTGVLITPKGKHAIISESVKNDKTKQKHSLKEGDQIKGMTVKEIGPNYVLMATKENTVRLGLYKGVKTRPAPAPEPAKTEAHPFGSNMPNMPNMPNPEMSAAAKQPGVSKNDTKPANVNPAQEAPVDKEKGSPFGGAKSGSRVPQDNSDSGNAGSAATNPFVEILRKGVEQRNQSNPGNAPVELPFNLPGMVNQ